jgi:cytochrome P450
MPTLQELIMSGQITLFALSKHADVSTALRDPMFSSDEANWEGADVLAQERKLTALQELMRHWMLFMDPPDHTRIRSLVNKAFTARTVERLRPRIRELSDELLNAVGSGSEIELMAEFAFPLPIRVIGELLGVPREDQSLFRDASQNLASVLDIGDKTEEILAEWDEAARPFVAYMRDLIEDRRRQPGNDLLSALIAARDDQDRLTDDELLGTVMLVLGAGFETTMNLIGNGVYTLLRHPDQLARLQKDPSLIGSTIEEILRFEPPVLVTARVCLRDAQVGENSLHGGQQGILMLAVANRDSEIFADPDGFDVCRAPNPHLTFGGGHHFCPGAALARLEGQIAIATLIERFPNLRLREQPEWRQTITLHGLKELWVEV